MNFSVIDIGGLWTAVLVGGLALALPGYALARLCRFARDASHVDGLTALVVGLAALPALDSVLARVCGLDAALVLTLALALVGAVLWARTRPRITGLALGRAGLGGVGLALWLGIVTFEWIDLDVAGKLYQPLIVFDAVKHAATTQAIFDSGAPPRDAFFLRPERASYYYFFYTVPALVLKVCRGLVDAKAAGGGLMFWTGVGAYGLVRLVLARLGLDRGMAARRRLLLIVAVMGAGGLDVLAVAYFAWTRGYWVADPLQWNDVQVGAWFEDILWVPHHVAALIAGTVGLIAASDAMTAQPVGRRPEAGLIGLAGLCFAAALGLSIWVCLAVCVTAAVWGLCLLVERRWRDATVLALAGLAALIVAAPQIIDLKAGRAGDPSLPIALTIRPFLPVQTLLPEGGPQLVANLFALPLNYGFEFGGLAIGSLIFWRRARSSGTCEFARVLVMGAGVGLLLGACLRSTLFNNDLGWRVLLLPLLAGTVWTVAALDDVASMTIPWRRLTVSMFCACLGLGWATVLYTAVSMRAYPFMTVNRAARFMASDPATERALRVAYGWASTNLRSSAVLQQNPTRKRAFAFGVYGRNPTGVADAYGSLYGADPRAVAARIEAVGPIFQTPMSSTDVAARAAANGIDDLVVTAADPVWSQPTSFVWHAAPLFASSRVRIIPVRTLEALR